MLLPPIFKYSGLEVSKSAVPLVDEDNGGLVGFPAHVSHLRPPDKQKGWTSVKRKSFSSTDSNCMTQYLTYFLGCST